MAPKMIASLSLPADILKQANRAAKEEHMSRSELIKEALKAYLEEREWAHMRQQALPFAQARGIRTEEDVEDLIREVRGGRGK